MLSLLISKSMSDIVSAQAVGVVARLLAQLQVGVSRHIFSDICNLWMLQAANGEKEALEAGCLGDPMFEILSMKEQGKNTKLYSAILVRELTILVEDIFFIS